MQKFKTLNKLLPGSPHTKMDLGPKSQGNKKRKLDWKDPVPEVIRKYVGRGLFEFISYPLANGLLENRRKPC
jgi:hypothetical protein